MSSGQGSEKDLMKELETLRDEIRLKLHLASMDARDEWDKLETRWQEFRGKAELDETAEEVGEAAGELFDELKKGYDRIRKALS